jgi:hypothetical protein
VAAEAARQAADGTGDLGYLSLALRGALWARDGALVQALAARLAVHPEGSATWKAIRAEGLGATAALEGRTDDATVDYAAAIRHWREPGHEFEAASAALDFAWAVGPEVPEARAAAEQARAVFERVGAKVYLDRLDGVLDTTTDSPTGRTAPVAARAHDP